MEWLGLLLLVYALVVLVDVWWMVWLWASSPSVSFVSWLALLWVWHLVCLCLLLWLSLLSFWVWLLLLAGFALADSLLGWRTLVDGGLRAWSRSLLLCLAWRCVGEVPSFAVALPSPAVVLLRLFAFSPLSPSGPAWLLGVLRDVLGVALL